MKYANGDEAKVGDKVKLSDGAQGVVVCSIGEPGKRRRYHEWEYTHGDVEVYDARGNHLGSANPETGEPTKPAVPGRRIDV